MGSSNFTARGLGLHKSANLELNLLCKIIDDVNDCVDYFEKIKAKCDDATDEIISNIDTAAYYRSPSEIILKIKQDYNRDFKDAKEAAKLGKMAKLFKLYDFQKRAVNEIYKRLQTYQVAMLADPVGAGKTLSALAVNDKKALNF